jgi:putative transposase
LEEGAQTRQNEWTSSIAVGNKSFVENVKALLGFRAKGREIIEGDKRYQLGEESPPYKALLGAENDDTGLENTYFWDVKPE